MKQLLLIILSIFFFCGCATWQGVKQDFNDMAEWSKSKVNHGASYIKEKTE